MEAIYFDYYPTFLYVDKYRFSDKWAYPPTATPYSLFRYVVSGSAVFSLGEQHYTVHAGDTFYIPQGSILSGAAINEEVCFISVRFVGSIRLQEMDMLRNLWNIPYQYTFGKEHIIGTWFEALYESAISKRNYKMLEVRGYLNLICAALARTQDKNDYYDDTVSEDRKEREALFDIASIQRRAAKSVQNSDPRITMVLDYIIAHPEENLSREMMCGIADISESTLRRLFKSQTGKTIYEFVKETKMTNAARRLLVTTEPISTISYNLGFEAPSYFGKCFKEVFGLSPQEYRKMSHEA